MIPRDFSGTIWRVGFASLPWPNPHPPFFFLHESGSQQATHKFKFQPIATLRTGEDGLRRVGGLGKEKTH